MSRQYPTPQALLHEHGLEAKKSWGQNFLIDERVLNDIVRGIPMSSEPVIELGSGLGALTAPMLDAGFRVIAVERDPDMQHVLRARFAEYPGFTLLAADAGHLDYRAIAREHGIQGPMTVVGNLPYQIGGRISVNLADMRGDVGCALLMLQREVVQRMVAAPGSKTFGLLSVLMQRTFDVQLYRKVSPGSFHPAPKIHSAVVKLVARPLAISDAADAALVRVAKLAFQHRRKTLRAGLGSWPEAVGALDAAGIDPRLRPETLDMATWQRFAEALEPGRL